MRADFCQFVFFFCCCQDDSWIKMWLTTTVKSLLMDTSHTVHVYGPFRSCAAAMPSWLDCSRTVVSSTAWFQMSNLLQSNLIAVGKRNTQIQ